MSTFTLAISCLTTSSLPWFMDLTFQVPMKYCSLQHRPCFYHHPIHNWVLFLLLLHPFILSGVISSLISSSILGTYRPGEFIFQCPIFLPFHTIMGFFRQEYWSGLLFPSLVDHIISIIILFSCVFYTLWFLHFFNLANEFVLFKILVLDKLNIIILKTNSKLSYEYNYWDEWITFQITYGIL